MIPWNTLPPGGKYPFKPGSCCIVSGSQMGAMEVSGGAAFVGHLSDLLVRSFSEYIWGHIASPGVLVGPKPTEVASSFGPKKIPQS